jgi:hypothetical protein
MAWNNPSTQQLEKTSYLLLLLYAKKIWIVISAPQMVGLLGKINYLIFMIVAHYRNLHAIIY